MSAAVDPIQRAIALYRLAVDRKDSHEGKVARRQLLKHLRKNGLKLDHIRKLNKGIRDDRVKTEPGWATQVWHIELAVQIANLRGVICNPFPDGHLVLRGPNAAETMREIIRVRGIIEKPSGVIALAQMSRVWRVTHNEPTVLLYTAVLDAPDTALTAAILAAYQPHREAAKRTNSALLTGSTGAPPPTGSADTAAPQEATKPPTCDDPQSAPPPAGEKAPPGKERVNFTFADDQVEREIIPPGRLRRVRGEARELLSLLDRYQLPGNTVIALRNLIMAIPTDVTERVPVERRLTG